MKIGDIVKLKSGGPEMTVNNESDDDNVRCVWFSEDGEVKYAFFPHNTLKIIEGQTDGSAP